MWRYQKPGFEAHLLTELQRQQQCSQFCDTLLKAEGMSVPAHSCILSAISPHMSSALSSTPSPPAGQSRLLEFRALGACTLLHMVRLLYCGEMAGEGENEKQQAICAATKLGISGLVEVTKSKSRGGGGGGGTGHYVEVGVQTEENEGRQSWWRREVRDGSTYLWKETLSDDGRDTWTQTEEIYSAPPAHPAASMETIDMNALQSLGLTDSHQFVPVTLVYPPNENQTIQVSSEASACVQETAGSTSVVVAAPPYPSVPFALPPYSRQTEPQSCWSGPQAGGGGDVTAGEEPEDEQIEQFEGNIAGFINYFLNPENKQGTRRGRGARRQRGARRAGTGQQRAGRPRGRPRGRPAGRGRQGFTHMVDVQEVGESNLQKMFLHRWGMRIPRTGQGGGAVGRKLNLKTRAVLPTQRRCPRRRGRGKVSEVGQSRDIRLYREEKGGNSQRGQKNTPKQFNQFYSGPSPCPPSALSRNLLSAAPSCTSPAASLLHTTRLPPPPPPPPQDQHERIDRLLEEVMMGLEILPNNSNGAAHSECPLPANGNKTDTQVPVLQLQCQGEVNDMLENFLQSFEQHVSAAADNEPSSSENNQPRTALSRSKRTQIQPETCHALHLLHEHTTSEPRSDGSSQNGSEPHEASSSNHAENSEEKPKRLIKRRPKQYMFSLEKKRAKKLVSSVDKQKDQQLYQNPVVTLDRSLEDKRPSKTKMCASSEKYSGKNHQEFWNRKIYPIRSKLREAQIADISSFLVGPLSDEWSSSSGLPRAWRRGRPKKKNMQPPSLISGESPVVQSQPVDPCCMDDQSEQNQEGSEVDLMVQPQEEEEERSGQKRRAESDEETRQHAALNKKICLDQMTTCGTFTPSSESESVEQEEVIDVETLSPVSLRDFFQGMKGEEEPNGETEECSLGEEMKSSDDEIIDVEGDEEDAETLRPGIDRLSHLNEGTRSHPAKELALNWTKKQENGKEKDVDMTGGSSPVPDPAIISWTVCSDGEKEVGDEEVDIVGEQVTD